MKTQPEALRLAEIVGGNCAAELRRLYAANIDCVGHFNALKAERDELLEALQKALAALDDLRVRHTKQSMAITTARATIAKATGGQA